jgi:hypothetical protein
MSTPGLPRATSEALGTLTAALADDVARLRDMYGHDAAIPAIDGMFSTLIVRLEGARDLAKASARQDAPRDVRGVGKEGLAEQARADRSGDEGLEESERNQSKNAENDARRTDTEVLSPRERGILVDEAILRFATEHQILFSIDEIMDMLERSGLATPRGSLVTKLSRMADAKILQRAFRGAYSGVPKTADELKRVQRWRTGKA